MRPRARSYVAALASGGLLAVASAPGPAGPLAFVALVPLLRRLVAGLAPGAAARAGFVTGLASFGLGYAWLPFAEIGDGPSLAAAYALALPGLASLTALWAGAVALLARRSARLALAAAPGLWVAFEFARAAEWVLSVPWHHLGYALAEVPALAQSASVVGLYGLSFWVAATNAGLVLAPRLPRAGRAALVAALAVPLLPGLSMLREGAAPEATTGPTPIRVAAVQPAIPYADRHRPERFHANLRAVLALSERALARTGAPADVVVWPESAWERPVSGGGDAFLAALAHDLGTPIVTGVWRIPVSRGAAGSGAAREPGATGASREAASARGEVADTAAWRNAAVLAAPDGTTRAVADKVHPVPVVERAPDGAAARALARLGLWTGTFAPGAPPAPFALRGAGGGVIRAGVLVCIDAGYPELARGLRRAGADVVFAVANEAGTSVWAARLHARVTRLRAIENRMPVVRVANGGPSQWIDAQGRVRGELASGAAGAAVHAVAAGAPMPLATRLGDVPAALAAASALAAAVAACARRAPAPTAARAAAAAPPCLPSPPRALARSFLATGAPAYGAPRPTSLHPGAST